MLVLLAFLGVVLGLVGRFERKKDNFRSKMEIIRAVFISWVPLYIPTNSAEY